MGRRFALPTSLKPNRHLASEQRAALVAVAFKYLGDLESATRTAEVAEYFATGRHNDLHQRRSLWKTANELERLTRTPARLQARLGTLDLSTALALGWYEQGAKSDAPRQQALRRFQRLQQQKNPASPEVLEAIAEFGRRARMLKPGRRVLDDNLKFAVECLAVIWEHAKGSRFRETYKEPIQAFVFEVVSATGVKLKSGEVTTAMRVVIQERARRKRKDA